MLRTVIIIMAIFWNNTYSQDKFKTSQDPVWQKAVVISAASINWFPELLEINEVTKDNNGKIEEYSDAKIAIAIDASGEVELALLSTQENGEDTTDKRKKTFTNDQYDYLPVIYDFNPFDSEHQKDLKVTRLNKTRKIKERTCQGFQYSKKINGTEKTGLAWIDVEMGYPVMVEKKIEDTEEEDVEVTNIISETYFHFSSEGYCYPEREITTMNLKASVMFFSWKGKTRIETRFLNYTEIY